VVADVHPSSGHPVPAATDVVEALTRRGETLACAESLTGGLVCAAVTDVPGASAVLRGGVVSYATEVKSSVLGLDPALLARVGAVDADVARQMARSVCRVVGSDWGVATTGVAGPDPQDGAAVGTVFVAVAGPRGSKVHEHHFDGDRPVVRAAAVRAALDVLRAALAEAEESPGAGG
jgi:nicotinamide-nucleotide amidase